MTKRWWVGAAPYTIVRYILHHSMAAERTEGIDREEDKNTNPEPQKTPGRNHVIGLRTISAPL
jgi:hypothetical protein